MTDKTIEVKSEVENEKIFWGGIDLGNKNYKLSIEDELFEFPLAFREITEYSYLNEESGMGTRRVKYKNKYYLVGNECNNILPRNKGEVSHREVANMIKLLGLAIFLEKKDLKEGKFNLVTGTPLNHHGEFEDEYRNLIIDEEVEKIIADGNEYKIQVLDTHITKQCAAVAPTIRNWKSKDNLLLVDLGGGTADISYFRNGSVVRYITMDFALNTIMEELGIYLNSLKLGLPFPDESNSGFLQEIEGVIKDGKYLSRNTLEVNGEEVDIDDIVNDWLKDKVAGIINNIQLRLELSDTVKESIDVYYLGGGALLLEDVLSKNPIFKNKKVIESPEFANVNAYKLLSSIRGW